MSRRFTRSTTASVRSTPVYIASRIATLHKPLKDAAEGQARTSASQMFARKHLRVLPIPIRGIPRSFVKQRSSPLFQCQFAVVLQPPEQRGTKRKNTACPAGKRCNATRLRVYTSVSHVVEHRSAEPSCSGLIEAGRLRANIAGIVRSARQLSQSLSADHSSGV